MYSYFLTIPKPSLSWKSTLKAENEKSKSWGSCTPYEVKSILMIWENVAAVHKRVSIAMENETFYSFVLYLSE